MQQTLFAVVAATAIIIGSHGAVLAATPDPTTAIVRQFGSVTISVGDDDALSNQPTISTDGSDND
jgi:hypothetical protein